MNPIRTVRLWTILLTVFAVPVLLQSCNSASADDENLAQMYADAIADAQTPTNAKISKDLTAIVAEEPHLVWEGTAGSSRLLVITTMSQYAYENYGYKTAYESGADYNLSETALSWVTAVPMADPLLQGTGLFRARCHHASLCRGPGSSCSVRRADGRGVDGEHKRSVSSMSRPGGQ